MSQVLKRLCFSLFFLSLCLNEYFTHSYGDVYTETSYTVGFYDKCEFKSYSIPYFEWEFPSSTVISDYDPSIN